MGCWPPSTASRTDDFSMPRLFTTLLLCSLAVSVQADTVHCGKEGVWIQILGSGGSELDDGRGAASYALWIDNHARLLVDPGPGAALLFEQAGGRIADLDAIAFSQLTADHAADLAALVGGATGGDRDRPLPLLGPDGNDAVPSMRTLIERLFGLQGAFPDLEPYLSFRGGFKLSATNVPSTGSRRWARFGTENVTLAAIPVHHGGTPTIAWRATTGGQSVTFGGDFNNQGNLMQTFAKGSDALVVSHAITEATRGDLRDRFATPSQLGRIATDAGVRMLILGHRMNRTRGMETQTETKIRESYAGPLIFANDLECWGL